jgi:serine phosphatase RsbU (regulator of sigma subunit)/putative methionine-R-sulfoxide reductase with GAF domain/anti-sigma regulatory factor (Ser/Thr protein kinase)
MTNLHARWRGLKFTNPIMPTKIFPAQFEYLDAIRDFAGEAARLASMDEKDIYNIQLATDEAASNIIEHAYAGVPDGQIEISTNITAEALTITMRDQGKKFDVSKVADPDVDASLEDRATGGLGLFFMRKLMDEVRFDWKPEDGNVLTMVKCCPGAQRPVKKAKPGYEDLFDLGGRILSATTFAAQRDMIMEIASIHIEGDVSLWLNESAFRLPDWVESLFSSEPPTKFLQMAHETGKTVQKQMDDTFSVAVPFRHEEIGLGALQVRRSNGKEFTRRDIRFLEGLARTASIALIAWHRVNVERWRLGQLGLVRTVSAQIANEPDIDELARKVTALIQSTFKYYYVGIFTLEPGQSALVFRSSTGGATRRKGRVKELVFSVEVGEGLVGHAALSGEEILVNNVRAEARYRPVDGLPETQSELVLPLKIEERVVGVLDIQSDALNAFHPYDLLVLRALADNVAVAIEGAKLYSDLQRQANRMRVVGEVSKQITSILNLRDLMQEVAELITTRFDFPYVHLFTVHPNRRQIHYEAGSGARSAALEGYILNLDDEEGIISWVAQHGETLLANNVDEDPRYIPSPLPPANTRSELCVPLIFNGHVNGILDVQSDQLNAFTEQDQLIIEMLGDSIAAAIRNADLYRSEQWRRQVGDSLREVAVLLSANATLDQVLDAVLTELERNLPSDIAAIWLLDDEEIYCAAVHGARAAELEQARRTSPDATSMLATALLSRQPYIRKLSDPPGPSAYAAGYDANHSAIAVPLRIGDQSVGVLTLAHHTPGRYGHEAQAMATTFASYAAVAIENARLYDSSQEQAYASAALLQVAQAVVSLSDIDEILGTIVRIMPILVGVERTVIYSWDSTAGLLSPEQEYGLPDELRELLWRLFVPGEFPMLDEAIQQGQMTLCQDAHLGPENWLTACPCSAEELEAVTASDDRLLVALPLMLKGEIFGVLLVEEAIGGRRFRNRRLEILNGVAQQIALAMQNDIFQKEMVSRERLETEVQLARQIQETFIPKKLPTPEGWELAARWRTARQMGGDFYDVIYLPDGRLGLFIADVADKGMPAALFMALTRTLVRAAVLQTDSPAVALAQVNDLLYPDCEQGMFVTAFYGALDPKTGRFTYANAGHNPPLWVHSPLSDGMDVRIELLTRTGIALGPLEHAEMSERSIDLAAGDRLIFYTDGITEAFSAAEELFGEERLYQVVQESKAESSQELLDEIDGAVSDFVGDFPVSDDITLIVLRRKE